MQQVLAVVICRLKEDASEDEAFGVGRDGVRALADAIAHFGDKPPHIVKDRIKRGIVRASYFQRRLD
jgi:hypothetical protein